MFNLLGTTANLDLKTIEFAKVTQIIIEKTLPTGEIAVELSSSKATVKCLYLVPVGGKSAASVALPEIGSMCAVANFGGQENPAYLILGFISPPINWMVERRKEMGKIRAGEILTQGSVHDGVKDYWRTASVKHDMYGRLLVETGDGDLQLIFGDLLSNEYTQDVAVIKDALTGENIIYKLQYGDHSTVIDRGGNYIQRWANLLSDISGDHIEMIAGRFIITSAKELKLTSRGQFIHFSNNGVEIKSLKDFVVNSSGAVSMSTQGSMALFAFLDMVISSTGNMQLKTSLDIFMTAANLNASIDENIVFESIKGDVILKGTALTALQTLIRGDEFMSFYNNGTNTVDGSGFPISRVVPMNALQHLTTNIKVP